MCTDSEHEPAAPRGAKARPYIGVFFECCSVYQRVYRRAEQAEYVGRCPRCLRKVRARVGAGGTDARIFHAK